MLNPQCKKTRSFFGLISSVKHRGKEVKAHILTEVEDINKNVACNDCNKRFVKN